MTLSPIKVNLREALKSILRMTAILICMGLLEWQQGIAIFPVRLSDVFLVAPLLAAVFLKRSGQAYSFCWGLGIGAFFMHMVELRYLSLGAIH
jgi:hypothetical protein